MAYKRISPQPVVEGGTGDQTFTAYAVITGGTTGTGALQNVVGVGTSGQVLTSAGAGALPAWQTLGGSSITITGDTGGAITSSSFTFTGGTTGLSFGGAGTTETLTFAGITANAGVVNLGTDSTANAINIGTVSNTGRVITIGNTTGTTGISELVGTGNFSLDGVAGSTYTIGASTTTGTITIGGSSQTGAITIGQSANTIFLNSSSNAASIRIAYNQTAGSVFIGHNMTTGTISIGSTAAQTGTIDIAPGTGAQTINIAAAGTGVKTVHIADGAVANVVTLGSTTGAAQTTVSAGTAGLTLQATNGTTALTSGTGTLGISNDAAATTVNLGTGAGAKTVTLGSTNTTSTTNLQSGSGGIVIPAFTQGALVTSTSGVISTVTGTAGFVLTANSGAAPSFQAVSSPTGTVLNASITLTSSQVKSLHSTPITAIAAPGAGLMINVIGAVTTLHYGGTNAFTASASQSIVLNYTNGAGVTALGLNFGTAQITATTNTTVPSNSLGYASTATTNLTNTPIVAYQTVATEISGNAANNNTIVINITYNIITP